MVKVSRRIKSGGEPKKLIVTTGDVSDFDGFLALSLYYKAALENGADVLFIMNFPAYFGEEKNVENKADAYRKADGLGYGYTYKTFVEAKQIRDDKGAFIAGTSAEGEPATIDYTFLELLHTSLSGIAKNIKIDNNIVQYTKKETEKETEIETEESVIEKNLKIDLLIMAFIAWYIADAFWQWQSPNPDSSQKTKPQLLFSLGGINSINPFSVTSIKDEYKTYGPSIVDNEKEAVKIKVSRFEETIRDKTTMSILNDPIYDKIWIDMNGSMAWYVSPTPPPEPSWISKIQGVFIMGGVLDDEEVNTMSSIEKTLNRFSCATMNQLYHPMRTVQFLMDVKILATQVFVISNNEINKNFSFTGAECEQDEFVHACDYMNILPSKAGHIIRKCFQSFYDTDAAKRKPFDVVSAYGLICNMYEKEQSNPLQKIPGYLYSNNTYGISIVSRNGAAINKESFITNALRGKQGDKPGESTNAFLIYKYKAFASEIDTINAEAFETNPITILELGSSQYTFLIQNYLSKDIIQNVKSIIYDFTGKQVYCFSDIEGFLPSYAGNTTVDPSVKRVINLLKRPYLPLRDNEAIVYTGDLLDRGPYSIRLMKGVLDLKMQFPNQILLIGGNRDFNKVRMIDEYYMTKEGETLQYKYASDALKAPFTEVPVENGFPFGGVKHGEWAAIFDDVNNIKGRVSANSKTFGTSDCLNTCKSEFKALRIPGYDGTDPSHLITSAKMYMAMGFIWKTLPGILKGFELYNGLYIKYLQQCHIIAAFKTGTNKFGIASHAGIPYIKAGKNPALGIITSPLGLVPSLDASSTKNMSLVNILNEIDRDKNKVLFSFAGISESIPIRKDETVKKFIQMSASSGPINLNSSEFSPIVTMVNWNGKGGPIDLKTNGMSFVWNEIKSTPKTETGQKKTKKGGAYYASLPLVQTNTFYNIFGHQPVGYIPMATCVKGYMFHVCLDVSKAEYAPPNVGNTKTFGMLVLNVANRDDHVIGFVPLPSTTTGVVNYSHKLTDFTAFFELDGTKTKGLPLRLKSDLSQPFAKLIEQGGGGSSNSGGLVLYKGHRYKVRKEGRSKFIMTKLDGRVALSIVNQLLKKKKAGF